MSRGNVTVQGIPEGAAVLLKPITQHYNCLAFSRPSSNRLPHGGAPSLLKVLLIVIFLGEFSNVKKKKVENISFLEDGDSPKVCFLL